MDPIEHYSVPGPVGPIQGPVEISIDDGAQEYSVTGVENADTYIWSLPTGTSGISITNTINVEFYSLFKNGTIRVMAARDGFGTGPESSLTVNADNNEIPGSRLAESEIQVLSTQESTRIRIREKEAANVLICLYEPGGRLILTREISVVGGQAELELYQGEVPQGFYLMNIKKLNALQNVSTRVLTTKLVIN